MSSIAEPVHFVGIGGIGMSGIARILLQLGMEVSGSDLKESEITKKLKKLGARVFIGHAAGNVPPETKTVVFSSAVVSDNPELVEAKKRGLLVIPRAEMLAWLMKRQESIGVAGAHGKTTTTAMISLMMEKMGWDPTIVIGGNLEQIDGNAKLGQGRYLVAEADESDGSFLKLFPKIAVITNIENDHLDYYRSINNINTAFTQFVTQLPEDGFAVVCLDNSPLEKIMKSVKGQFITYGIERQDADFTARQITCQGLGSRADIFFRGRKLGELELQVPGKHNIANALAAIAVGMQLGMSFQETIDGLKEYSGVKRRFELIDRVNGVTIVDDYAHHPTELRATLKAARDTGFPRIIAVFQPHRFSRTKLLQFEFGDSFGDADLVVINEIYSAQEKPIPGVTAQLIVNAIRNSNSKEVVYCGTEDEIINYLVGEVHTGDLVLTLGAGNIREAGIRLAGELRLNGGTGM